MNLYISNRDHRQVCVVVRARERAVLIIRNELIRGGKSGVRQASMHKSEVTPLSKVRNCGGLEGNLDMVLAKASASPGQCA